MSAQGNPAKTVDEIEGMRAVAAPVAALDRISSLDFIRGLAVMGILGANIITFGQPMMAYMSPSEFLVDTGDPQGWQWIAQFVLIDGKMRGLFTLLFGAGMYLFMERAWAKGSTRSLQAWRLILLLGFGLIHFYLIWFGDILAGYALIGLMALAFMHLGAGMQMRMGLFGYILGSIILSGLMTFPYLFVDTAFGQGEGLAEVRAEMLAGLEVERSNDAVLGELKQSGDYAGWVAERFEQQWFIPFVNPLFFIFETLPLMLMGMGLYRLGFFSGAFDQHKMKLWGWIGLITGGALHVLLGLFVKQYDFSYYAANAAFIGWSMLPRLPMVLGFAALLIVYSPGWTGWLAERVRAAGRAAFTNYLGTSILMLFIFHGWALGLFGKLNRPELYLVMLGAWVLMLAWSKPWLDHFRYGPLEWLWRCMTYRQWFPLRK